MKLFYIFSIISILVLFSNKSNAQQFNRPVPNALFPYEYVNNGLDDTGYFLMTPQKLYISQGAPDYKVPYSALIDSDGYICWYDKGQNIDFKFYQESNLYSYTFISSNGVQTVILDNNFNSLDTISSVNTSQDVHDIQIADNGNWLLTTIYFDTVDLSAYTFNGVQGSITTVIKGGGVQEIDGSGNLIFDWNSNDYIFPTETYDFYGYSDNVFDYCHINAIEEDDDGHILISFRHLNAVYKINRLTGSVIWKLGGNSSDFTFLGDNGFSGQHDIRKLQNGNYSLFNNGNMDIPQITRGLEYQLDTINWTATLISEYIHPTNLYAQAMGNYQYTNDYLVSGFGFIRYPFPSVILSDHSNNILSEFYLEDSVVSYRVQYAYPTLPERPQITCEWNGFNWTLKGPDGASTYRWSVGGNTQSIDLTQTGTYQVWIPYGTGFLGSLPLVVTDINDPCGSLGLEKGLSSLNADGNYILYNLLGQTIVKPQKETIYIQLFESGYSRKIMFMNTPINNE